MSAGRAEELAGEARRMEEAVRAARAKKKDAEGTVKRLHARGKQLQVMPLFGGGFGGFDGLVVLVVLVVWWYWWFGGFGGFGRLVVLVGG